jgi:nucleotide-binding universal stress UspA family protein
MQQVVVPVRYPLSPRSKTTLREAIDIAAERDAALTVLHVNLYQDNRRVTRRQLRQAVEREFGTIENARYLVRRGLLVEETILEEVVAEGADVVVVGKRQASRWQQMMRRLTDDPDVEQYLRTELDCEVVTVAVD